MSLPILGTFAMNSWKYVPASFIVCVCVSLPLSLPVSLCACNKLRTTAQILMNLIFPSVTNFFGMLEELLKSCNFNGHITWQPTCIFVNILHAIAEAFNHCPVNMEAWVQSQDVDIIVDRVMLGHVFLWFLQFLKQYSIHVVSCVYS